MFLSIRFLPSQLLCCSEYSRLPKTRYSFCFIYVVGGTVSIMFPPVCRQNKWRITSAEHCQHSYLADLRWWGERPDIWFGNQPNCPADSPGSLSGGQKEDFAAKQSPTVYMLNFQKILKNFPVLKILDNLLSNLQLLLCIHTFFLQVEGAHG